ncbi:MAG: penicillin-binding transpeptidase domain-containing protein, partial [Caulobacteraceae bacterium]
MAKFRALGGIGMVVNVKTGEILGFSSQPDFDLNAPGKTTPDQMMNRGSGSVYELGSVFKAFTLAAGLDSGVVTLNSSFDVSHPHRAWRPSGARFRQGATPPCSCG